MKRKKIAFIQAGAGFVMLLLVCVFLSQSLMGQENSKKLQFNGNLGLYEDFYSMASDTADALKARRPGNVVRMNLNNTLSYGNISVSISLMYTVGQRSAILPQLNNGNFIDFIRHPSNRIGIAPQYKWVQVLLGTQAPQYSELSVGDLPVLGAGVNLTAGLFRFSCFAGTPQLALEL